LNTGLEHAKGDFISLLDSDDVYHKEKLGRQIEVFKDPEIYVSYTGGWRMDSSGNPTGRIFDRDITRPSVHQKGGTGVLHELLKDGFTGLLGGTIMLRRECLLYETPDPELTFYNDWDYWVRLARRLRFGYVQEPLYGYRIYAGNSWAHLSENSFLETQLVMYKKWLRELDGLDRESKKYIVQNECRCYIGLHNHKAVMGLALRNNEARKSLAKAIAWSLSRRVRNRFNHTASDS
jgi:glycosyltransferase involved in cell wall biosynthesis